MEPGLELSLLEGIYRILIDDKCSVSQLLMRHSVVKQPLDCVYMCTGSCVEIVVEM